MDEDFKKWLCEKAGKHYITHCQQAVLSGSYIEILIKAMWAINRGENFHIVMGSYLIDVHDNRENGNQCKTFTFKDHNNSEQEALTAALKYIYKEST